MVVNEKQLSLVDIDEQIKALEEMRFERAKTVLVDFKTGVEKLAADMGLSKAQLQDALRPLVGRKGGKGAPASVKREIPDGTYKFKPGVIEGLPEPGKEKNKTFKTGIVGKRPAWVTMAVDKGQIEKFKV